VHLSDRSFVSPQSEARRKYKIGTFRWTTGARGVERLLGDAMQGDSMLFVREDAVEAAWAVVDPILGNSSPLHAYASASWGPAEADRLAADLGGWHNPERSSQ